MMDAAAGTPVGGTATATTTMPPHRQAEETKWEETKIKRQTSEKGPQSVSPCLVYSNAN